MPKEKTVASEYVAFPVRFPPDLLASIKAKAAEERRAVNTQILIYLEQATKNLRKRQHTEQRDPLSVRLDVLDDAMARAPR